MQVDKPGFFIDLRRDYARLRALGNAPPARLWRVAFSPRMYSVVLIRFSAALYRKNLRALSSVVSLLNLLVFKVEVPSRAIIGPGLVLPHPMGIVIGSARIGKDVTIFQNVTLGARAFDGAYDVGLRPILEDGALIGSGAVVLGPVTVGCGATVAANSLLLCNLPAGGSAMGVPAQVRSAPLAPELRRRDVASAQPEGAGDRETPFP